MLFYKSSFVFFPETFSPSFNPNTAFSNKLVDSFALCNFLFYQLTAVVHCLYFVLDPFAPGLPSNFLSPKTPLVLVYSFNIPFYFALFVYYSNIAIVLNVALYFFSVFVTFIIHELKIGSKRTYKSVPELRTPETITRIYRSVDIVFGQFNSLIGPMLIPLQAFATLICVFSSYILIKQRQELDTVLCAFMASLPVVTSASWCLILTMGGYIHTNGVKVLKSWPRFQWASGLETKYMLKVVKSCKPVSMCYGKQFVIQRKTLLIFVRGLSRGLMRVLLSVRP